MANRKGWSIKYYDFNDLNNTFIKHIKGSPNRPESEDFVLLIVNNNK